MLETGRFNKAQYLSKVASIYGDKTKSMSEILSSFRCISESYNNLEVQEFHYSEYDYAKCTKEEQEDFYNDQLQMIECLVTNNIQMKSGLTWNWKQIFNLLSADSEYAKCDKVNRKVVYPTSSNTRPVGDIAYSMWNGLQIIDLDIKDAQLAQELKQVLFDGLKRFHWFLGICVSASGKGLHVWTKVTPISIDQNHKRIEYLCNFRHKYSYIYIILLNYVERNKKTNYCKSDIVNFMDMAMARPQQGIFITSDKDAKLNTNFQDLRLDVNFESAFDNGISSIDWISHEDLKEIFAKLEWFNNDTFNKESNIDISQIHNTEDRDIKKAQGSRHYKHAQRWQLANTLTSIYGAEKAYEVMCEICSETPRKELRGDVNTAKIHNKPISIWAVQELNKRHGFKIKVEVDDEQFVEKVKEITDAINNNPTVDYIKDMTEKDASVYLHINHDQYLGDIKDEIIKNFKKINLLEAGAGYGKTEMIKSLDGRVLLILPFTSTIKSKVEWDDKTSDWLNFYGNHRASLNDLMGERCISMTIDKFSKLNLYELNAANFKYIVIDESHLLFTSSYRDVMSPTVQRLANCGAKVVMMTGTPTGEKLFFPNIQHIKVEKEDLRTKKFQVYFSPTKDEQLVDMCTQIADDIIAGNKILFPTNKGNLYYTQVIGMVENIIKQKTDNKYDRPINYFYYKKSNTGEQEMEDIDHFKTFGQNDIIFCTSFLSVGVDICDKFDFRVYFSETWIAQDIEQFANRIRNNDLYIKLFLPKVDAHGYPINYSVVKPLNLEFDKNDLITVRDLITTCNDLLDRNNEEFRYNPIVQSILGTNKYLKYDENDCKYYIDETAYKLLVFEKRYTEFGKQLQVLLRGMRNFGYTIESFNSDKEMTADKKEQVNAFLKGIRSQRIDKTTKDTFELLEHLSENNIEFYKEITKGNYDLFKSDKYEDIREDNNLYVKSIECVEKNVPIIVRLHKFFTCDTIKEIYQYCVEAKSNAINYTALDRVCKFMKLDEQRRKKRVDFPVLRFLQDTKKWVDENQQRTKLEVEEFLNVYTCKYANTVKNVVVSDITFLETIKKYISELFDVIVIRGRAKNATYNLKMFELLWDKRDKVNLLNIYGDINTQFFFAEQLIEAQKKYEEDNKFEEDDAPDFDVTEKLKLEDIENETIVNKTFEYDDYSTLDGSNNRFMRKQQNTAKQYNIPQIDTELMKDLLKQDKTPNLFTEIDISQDVQIVKDDLPF